MPVFFYIDPDYVTDPFLENTDEITLSYTFFESKPGLQLPTYNSGVGRWYDFVYKYSISESSKTII